MEKILDKIITAIGIILATVLIGTVLVYDIVAVYVLIRALTR